jgi:N-acetylglucosamine kinase-like BadF-type ATPase
MEYFVGIDGGGSKTDFVVADENLQIIKKVHIPKGTNPWQGGLETTLNVLGEGLAQLSAYRDGTVAVIAGIGGCFSHNKFTSAIEDRLRQFCPQARLVGDLPIGFRAVTEQTKGIIAIAGTGSSVVQFFGDGSHYLYDAIGCGGRDIGYWLAMAYARRQIGEAGRTFLSEAAPVLDSNTLQTTEDFYHDTTLRQLPKLISQLDPQSEAFADIRHVVDMAADRWRFKLYGIITKFLLKESDDSVTVVLSGGLWKFDYFREQVIQPLQQEFSDLKIVFNPEVEPVLGALRMAREL